jgi:hypothetical protein
MRLCLDQLQEGEEGGLDAGAREDVREQVQEDLQEGGDETLGARGGCAIRRRPVVWRNSLINRFDTLGRPPLVARNGPSGPVLGSLERPQ